MSFEVIQQEIAQWPPESVRRLQGYLVTLNHQRGGQLDRFAAKLDGTQPDRWISLEEAEAHLGKISHADR